MSLTESKLEYKKSAELQFVLESMVEIHRHLIGILNEEYDHMANLNIKGLADSAQTKEVLLGEIQNRESLRIQATQNLFRDLDIKDPSATLVSVFPHLSKEESDNLQSTRTTLMLLMTQAKQVNSRNMEFVQSSLERIEEMKKNALGISNNTTKENYSNSGARQPIAEQGGRLLSTEA